MGEKVAGALVTVLAILRAYLKNVSICFSKGQVEVLLELLAKNSLLPVTVT